MNPGSPTTPLERRTKPWQALALLGVCVAGSVALFLFPPERSAFYPRCHFNLLTGLHCPGCGGLRAAHELLHGHLAAAAKLNFLAVLISPFLAIAGAAALLCLGTGRRFNFPLSHQAWWWALVVALVVFGIARNIPAKPFLWFAP